MRIRIVRTNIGLSVSASALLFEECDNAVAILEPTTLEASFTPCSIDLRQ